MDTILLVHPDRKATGELTFLLQHSGFQVLTAVDADQALVEISKREPDVIVMPEALAKINGDQPCVRIRGICKAPFIILGEDEHEWAGIHFLNSGADTYIPSRVDPRLLLAWVRSLLRRYKRNFKEYER